MRAQLTIDTDNAAFGDTREEAAIEVARILEATARKLRDNPEEYGRCYETLRDLNGNDVGRFGMKGPEDPGFEEPKATKKWKAGHKRAGDGYIKCNDPACCPPYR